MSRYDHIFFVCTNVGRPDDGKKRCGKGDAEGLLERLKACVRAEGLNKRVRVVRSGCLDLCNKGCAVAAYSKVVDAELAAERWYTELSAGDAEALFAAHVGRGEPYVPQAPAVEASAKKWG